MNEELLNRLRTITEEEQKILSGGGGIEKERYTSGDEFAVDPAKMLASGTLIALRPNTRFVHFPLHRHNYVEMMYVCEGAVTTIIGGERLVIRQGELLFLNQYTKHEILPAGEHDIMINFIVLPQFFDVALEMIGKDSALAEFLVNTLKEGKQKGEYMYFQVAEMPKIQNLLENMVYALINLDFENSLILQTTMGLLLMHLLDSVQHAKMRLPDQYENMVTATTRDYIKKEYSTATLTELSRQLHLPPPVLSKMIKKLTGDTFKDLLMERRLKKAAKLLQESDLPIQEIIADVGYENHSYFHRIFKKKYGMTPKEYRKQR